MKNYKIENVPILGTLIFCYVSVYDPLFFIYLRI